VSLVISRLEYGSATLASLTACQLDRFQSVLNAAPHLIYRSRKYEHVTPLMHDLHWLRIPERIMFRLVVLAYRCQNRLAPQYLADDLHHLRRSSHGEGCVRRRPRHWSSQKRRVLRSAITLSLLLPLGRGKAFRSRLRHQHPFRFSGSIWSKQFCLFVWLLLNGTSAPIRLSVSRIVEIGHDILLVVSERHLACLNQLTWANVVGNRKSVWRHDCWNKQWGQLSSLADAQSKN